MTFRPYSDKLKADDSDQILNIPTLIEGRVLVRNGKTITTSLVGADQVAPTGFPIPTADTQISNKQYVDERIADAIAGISLEDLGFLKTDGSRPMDGYLNLGNNSIINLSAPLDLLDATNKEYVDGSIADAIASIVIEDLGFLKTDGSRQMDGYLNLGNHAIVNLAAPIDLLDAANKQYVDAQIAAIDMADLGFLKLDGSRAMEANLSLGIHRITNLVDPIDMQDAATRYYVESFSSNRHLSNLCAGTAVNQWLIPDGDLTQSLGAQQGIYGSLTPKNWASVLANEFISAGIDDLYLSSCSPDLEPDYTGRNVRIQADGTGLQSDVDGGDVHISTAIPSGLGVRGSVFIDALSLDLGLSKITNVAAPTVDRDAANKKYVDDTIAAIISTTSFVGLLTIHAPPTIDGYTGSISVGGSVISNAGTPILASDVATKEYVDSLARLTVATTTTDYEVSVTDRIIFVDPSIGPVSVTLPSATGQAGLALYIKRVTDGGNTVFIYPPPGQTIDGLAVHQVFLQWESHTIVSDGTNWFLV